MNIHILVVRTYETSLICFIILILIASIYIQPSRLLQYNFGFLNLKNTSKWYYWVIRHCCIRDVYLCRIIKNKDTTTESFIFEKLGIFDLHNASITDYDSSTYPCILIELWSLIDKLGIYKCKNWTFFVKVAISELIAKWKNTSNWVLDMEYSSISSFNIFQRRINKSRVILRLWSKYSIINF